MRRLKIKNQENYSSHTNLIFLTQALEELLYDHSNDSYKAPALSSPARINELIRLVIDTKNAGVSYETLTPFVNELKWSITNEKVLDAGQKAFCISICEQFSSDGGKPELIISKLRTIRLIFEGYLKKVLALLKEKLLDERLSKSDIHLLASQLIAHAEFEGYHRRYISLITKKFLAAKLANNNSVDIAKVFDNFANKFEEKRREWEIYVYTDKDVKTYKQHSSPFGIQIPSGSPDLPQEPIITKFFEYATEKTTLIILDDIQAFDADSARNIGLERLEGLLSTISFCCHDKVINYLEPVLLHDKTTDFWLIVDKRPHPMVIGNRSVSAKASEEFEKLINPLLNRKLAPVSTRKLLNAFEYHRAALESRLPENQLVDLWAALEGLLPSPEGIRIKFFCNTLSSVLTLTHTEKLLKVFEENLNHEPKKVRDIVSSVQGAGMSNFEKVVALIAAKELEDKRVEIAELIEKENPLLLFRFYQLNEQYKSKKRIGNTLKRHQEKINWHIHRIYHSRNMIVHSAESLPYLPTLVENLHLYLDTLIHAITKLARNHNRPIDVDTAVSTLAAHEKFLIQDYSISEKNPDIECDISNHWDLVFGSVNPLAPEREVKD